MQLFIDTANLDEIREAHALGVICGVTTNPSLVAREGGDFVQRVADICDIVEGPVSAEVIAQDAEGMIREGRMLAKISEHVVVKIPLTGEGLKACKVLSSEGIDTNVTLCFSASQALLAALAGATYISPFMGRVDDIAWDGANLIAEIAELYALDPQIQTKVLAASIRHPLHLTQSAAAGADVATVPMKVIRAGLKHPLTDIGNEKFLKDWETVPDKDIVAQVEAFLARKNG